MSLGTIELEAGPHKTTLSASEIAGKEVANMRLLMFRRLDGMSENDAD